MWYVWIISSGIISIISVCTLYILNKDNMENEKKIDYRNTFITIMIVSLVIMSLGNVNSEQIVPNISNIGSVKVNTKVPF